MTTKQTLMVGAIAIGFGIGVYFLTKTNKNGTTLLGGGRTYIDEGDTNTVPVFSAKQKSGALYNAMNKYNGTDENAIIQELSGVTQNQFGLISQVFGLQNYNNILGYNTIGGSKQPLKVWLKEELSEADYNLLRKKFSIYL